MDRRGAPRDGRKEELRVNSWTSGRAAVAVPDRPAERPVERPGLSKRAREDGEILHNRFSSVDDSHPRRFVGYYLTTVLR